MTPAAWSTVPKIWQFSVLRIMRRPERPEPAAAKFVHATSNFQQSPETVGGIPFPTLWTPIRVPLVFGSGWVGLVNWNFGRIAWALPEQPSNVNTSPRQRGAVSAKLRDNPHTLRPKSGSQPACCMPLPIGWRKACAFNLSPQRGSPAAQVPSESDQGFTVSALYRLAPIADIPVAIGTHATQRIRSIVHRHMDQAEAGIGMRAGKRHLQAVLIVPA